MDFLCESVHIICPDFCWVLFFLLMLTLQFMLQTIFLIALGKKLQNNVKYTGHWVFLST